VRERGIVQEAKRGSPLHRGIDGGSGMSLSLKAARQISPSKGADLQRTQHRPECGLDVGRRAELLLKRDIELPADR